jgi:hypothetical protein
VTVAWAGTLPGGATMKGLSLYRATGGLLRSTQRALIGGLPRWARHGRRPPVRAASRAIRCRVPP